MAQIGQMNRLKIIKSLEFGLYVDAEALGEVLIPKRYLCAQNSRSGADD